MGFRDREKDRQVALKSRLFSTEACGPGTYREKPYEFCLRNDLSTENIHESVRDRALAYFDARKIDWHDGHCRRRDRDAPSNHLCCSQSHCVNSLFLYRDSPGKLKAVLSSLGYPVDEVLPVSEDAVVSYLHVAPRANRELVNRINAPKLCDLGEDIHSVWEEVVAPDRFRYAHFEDLLGILTENAPDRSWADWMGSRYGGMA